jgi:hypothetical protein
MQDYLSSIKDLDTFTGIERIQKSRYTEAMPTAEQLSKKLPDVFDTLRDYPSGNYVDIRKMTTTAVDL